MSRKTIFEQIKEETKGKSYGASWYRRKVQTIAANYKVKKIFKDEKVETVLDDEFQDDNEVRVKVLRGHLYIFQYEATTKRLPYYDTNPLVYVIGREEDGFIGANLHYVQPKHRAKIITNLLEKNQIVVPSSIVHKYLYDNVKGRFLDLGKEEWETAILLPIDNFVYERGGRTFSYKKNDVWGKTHKKRADLFKEKRIFERYTNETKI